MTDAANKLIVVYRDLNRDSYDGVYEVIKTKNNKGYLLKEQVIKGEYGYPDMHINRFYVSTKQHGEILIISYTDNEIDETKKLDIIEGALRYLKSSNLL